MRRVIASLGDDAPSASAKRAECAKGDRLVVHVDVLGLEDSYRYRVSRFAWDKKWDRELGHAP